MKWLSLKKREEIPAKKAWLIRIVAVVLSVLCAGLVILLLGFHPFVTFGEIIKGALGSKIRLTQTVLKAVPLTITTLGIIIAFKMKFWNIGGEGQIMIGALAASVVALNFPDMPRGPLLLCMGIAAVIGGGLWAFIPAFFKAKMGTNETIFTLMLNYLAIKFVTYLQYGPWRDPDSKGFPKVADFTQNAVLPNVFGLHIGWIIALLLTVAIFLFMNYTKKGYEVSVVGESIDTARYAGMNIQSIIITAMLISGGLCGLTGMIQASAIEKTLTYSLSAGMGFTAIITAWLSRLNALASLFVCIAFAVLLQGGAYIQISMQIPAAVADMIQGILLFFVLSSEFFLQYKVNFHLKKAKGVA